MTQLLSPKIADLYQRLGVKAAFDGDFGPHSDAFASYNRLTDIIHFPPTGPRWDSVALHELGHWTGGPLGRERWRKFGVRALDQNVILRSFMEGSDREDALSLLDLVANQETADYAADEVIAQTMAVELSHTLNTGLAPHDSNYLSNYLSGAPRAFTRHFVPALIAVGKAMGDLVLRTAYRVEAA